MPEPTELLSSSEAAASLDIERSTVSRWVASGRLVPALKLPGQTGSFLFTPEAVEAARAEPVSTEGA